MDFRARFAIALVLLSPACTALVAPDPARLGGTDGGARDGSIGTTDAFVTDGARPDADVPDGGPACPPSCDDSVACTTDSCDAASGTCRHEPNDGACGDGMRCAGPAGCVPILCTASAECDDGDACNGAETCNPGGPGASPTTGCAPGDRLDCRDDADCTEDHCDPTMGCLHVVNDAACDDGADCTADACTPTGCVSTPDDSMCNGGCRVGATCVRGTGCTGGVSMTCSTDGNPCTSDPTTCDETTGTCLHPVRDGDGDGHLIATATGSAGTVSCGGDDCNDGNGSVYPGAVEVCNGIDDNCMGGIDEGGVCVGTPDACASEQRITLTSSGPGAPLTGSASGGNAALADNYRASCGGSGGHDAVYFVELGAGVVGAVDMTISTDAPGTTFDTVLAAQVGTSCGTFSRACNDDISSTNTHSSITICVSPSATSATRVHLLVDGYDGSAASTGNYTVSVSVSPHPGGFCP